MKVRYSFQSGLLAFDIKKIIIQFYHPYWIFRSNFGNGKQFCLFADNRFILTVQENYFNTGFQIFGLGVEFDYENKNN